MKWFVKALRHYADFSGRARRKEFWMFVLFNVIFSFAWLFLMLLIVHAGNSYLNERLPLVISLSWSVLVLLPGLAVSVRRLHDLGKSGWMVLVGLIPAIGGIWLIVLLATGGNPGENQYGPDPKRSPESFGDRAKLTSLGIALTVASGISLLVGFLMPGGFTPFQGGFNLIMNGALLAVGILLLHTRQRRRARGALLLLMISALLMALRGVMSWSNIGMFLEIGGWQIVVDACIYPLLYLSIGLFAGALRFEANPKLVRSAGVSIIVFAVMSLLWQTGMLERFGAIEDPSQLLSLFYRLTPAALILLAWTFLSKEEELAVTGLSPEETARYEADETVVYRPSSADAPAGSQPAGGSGGSLGWKIFGLFVSIGLIIGGASGELVLRGTKSSEALVIVGILFLIADIVALATHKKKGNQKEEYEQQLAEGVIQSVGLAVPATIRVVRDPSFVGSLVSYNVYLNHEFVGKIKNGKSLDIVTTVSHNIITVFDHNDNAFRGDFTTDLEEGGYAEVHVKAGRFVKNK